MADPNFAQATAARNATSAGGNDFSGAGYKKNVMHQTGGVDDFASGGEYPAAETPAADPRAFMVQKNCVTFPSNLGADPKQLNFMLFQPMEISGGKANARNITFRAIDGATNIALPIPTGINTQYQQSWSAATVEGRNAMLADKGGDVLQSFASAISKGDVVAGQQQQRGISSILKQIGGDFDFGSAKESFMNNVTDRGYWDQLAGGVTTELTGMVAAGPAEGLATAAQYGTQMRAVKQTMMSYGGPGFRSFSYNFSLKPFSKPESDAIESLLYTFKLYSAPNQNATRYTRVYDLPAVFKIRFYHGSQENKYIDKIGHCALSNISITYGGDKFTTFAGSHAPVQVDLSLQFQEMELLNRAMIDSERYGGVWPRETTSSGGSFSSDHYTPNIYT